MQHRSQTLVASDQKSSPKPEQVLEQLDRLVQSVHFRNSKRYPALLRFVVEKTLKGEVDNLKERTLGVEVFGRSPDYDTNADPIVRFTASEIRKRIAQYYLLPEHEYEIRFDLPLGSYVPQFAFHDAPVPPVQWTPTPLEQTSADVMQDVVPHRMPSIGISDAVSMPNSSPGLDRDPARTPTPSRFVTWLVTAATLLLTVATALWVRHPVSTDPASSGFWSPLLSSKNACLIVIGVHSFDLDGRDLSPLGFASLPGRQQSMLSIMLRSNMVPISDVVSYGALTTLLARSNHLYATASASETTFDQLHTRPIILLGGFNNIWTMRLTSQLRYHFVVGQGDVHLIVDSEHPEHSWSFDSAQSALNNVEDYGIVAEFFDPQIEQHVIVVSGIGKHGTEAAAEFITANYGLSNWIQSFQALKHKNFEAVISTQTIEGHHGPPHVVASTSW